MTIRKRAASALFVLGAAAAAISLGATPVLAASTTLTVKVSRGGAYTATASKAVLTDRGVSVTCVSTPTTKASTATGVIPSAKKTAVSPVTVGSVKSLSFKNCHGPLGAVRTRILNLPYNIKVDSATTRTGNTDIMVTGIDVKVNAGKGCTFTETGKAPGYYSNSRHRLHMTPALPVKPLNTARLTISKVSSGCLGAIHNGDHPAFTSTYTLNRPLTIHSTAG
jgi:hypothetical protein